MSTDSATVVPSAVSSKEYKVYPIDDVFSLPKPVKYVRGGSEYEVHPMSFSLPRDYFVETIEPKSRGISSIIPGNVKTYSVKHKYAKTNSLYTLRTAEQEYLMLYRESFFGVTKCKGGWDALRHVEILASGCMPLWIDLEFLPRSTGAFYPRKLIQQAMALPGVFVNLSVQDYGNTAKAENSKTYDLRDAFYNPKVQQRYFNLVKATLEHSKEYLSTEGQAKYVLNTLSNGHHERIRSVLFLAEMKCDYSATMLLHGLKSLLGAENVTDVWLTQGKLDDASGVKHELLYSTVDTMDAARAKKWTLMAKPGYEFKGAPIHPYAQGFMYAFKLEDSPRVRRRGVRTRLRAREWDAVVFGTGNALLNATLMELVRDAGYAQGSVAVVLGPDKPHHHDDFRGRPGVITMAKFATVFQREIVEDPQDAPHATAREEKLLSPFGPHPHPPSHHSSYGGHGHTGGRGHK